jgi:hypothetical protein
MFIFVGKSQENALSGMNSKSYADVAVLDPTYGSASISNKSPLLRDFFGIVALQPIAVAINMMKSEFKEFKENLYYRLCLAPKRFISFLELLAVSTAMHFTMHYSCAGLSEMGAETRCEIEKDNINKESLSCDAGICLIELYPTCIAK